MTRDEAIRTLQSMKSDFPLPKAAQTRRAQNDALDVAIEVLKAEPCEDAISRQAAIDALKEHRGLYCGDSPNTFSKLPYGEKCRVDELDTAIATLVNLPSVQPEVKKISYTDCANAMLMMWMDEVLTDGEYNRIMDKLNEHEKKNGKDNG